MYNHSQLALSLFAFILVIAASAVMTSAVVANQKLGRWNDILLSSVFILLIMSLFVGIVSKALLYLGRTIYVRYFYDPLHGTSTPEDF